MSAPMIDPTPRQVVAELDQYVIGQEDAKKAVAIALRNRWRRARVSEELREEIQPKNIIMIGPTGVGKTEVARRLARLTDAPFVKVEASKFTEVGYVGRDCESIIRELMESAVALVTRREKERMETKASANAEELILDALLPMGGRDETPGSGEGPLPTLFRLVTEGQADGESEEAPQPEASTEPKVSDATRERFRKMLRDGEMDHREIEIRVQGSGPAMFQMFAPGNGAEDFSINEMMNNLFKQKGKAKSKKMSVAAAREILIAEEAEKLLDNEEIALTAKELAENHGIVFIDEIDKIVAQEGARGADVSREGVQRDLLPIVEGSTVATKYGQIKTDHVLFIAAGAFHKVKPSDMIPELQGRFPIRVELKALTEEDFIRILSEPKNALTRQYSALLAVDGVDLSFEESGIRRLAALTVKANAEMENIGARRLQTLLEKLLEDIAFNAPDITDQTLKINDQYVDSKLSGIIENYDLGKFIL